jgi:hypothetical protein
MSDACNTKTCRKSTSQPYESSSGTSTGASVDLRFGDSSTGTNAAGPVVLDTVSVAGLSMDEQPFAAVNDTNNSAVQNGGAGIFGLGFPAQRYALEIKYLFIKRIYREMYSFVQAAVVNQQVCAHEASL